MTSPFVDRVEYHVIGRDTNASRTFRDVADAADDAGTRVGGLSKDLDRFNSSIDDTTARLKDLHSSLGDLSKTRELTVKTNVREVLGSVEDNRKVLDLVNDRFESMTVRVTATVNQLVNLNDGLTTIDDRRTSVIRLADDTRQLTQSINATVDSVTHLRDGLNTVDDSRNVVVNLGDDTRRLTQDINATVDSVTHLRDGLNSVDDSRNVVITLGDDTRQLTQDINATVDSVTHLRDGLNSVDDSRNVIIDLGDDTRTLTQNIDATVDSVTRLHDGLNTIEDGRTNIINLDDDTRQLTQNIDATVDSVTRLHDGLNTIEDGRTNFINLADDTRTLTQNIDATVDSVTRLHDGINTIDDNRNVIITLGDDTRRLTQDINATVDSVTHLRDGINSIDDSRNVFINLGDDTRRLTQDIDATVDSTTRLHDGINSIDDSRAAIGRLGDDFHNLHDEIENDRVIIGQFREEVARTGDDAHNITSLRDNFREVGSEIDRTRDHVRDLDRDLRNLPTDHDINIDPGRRIIETISSDRDRWERAGIAAGQSFLTAFLTRFGEGFGNIPFIGPPVQKAIEAMTALSPQITAALIALTGTVTVAAIGVVVNAVSAALLLALGGGVIVAGFLAAFTSERFRRGIKSAGSFIVGQLGDAIESSGFIKPMLDALQTLKVAFDETVTGGGKLKIVLRDMFTAAGPLIAPLVDGLLGFLTELIPGITRALTNMKPIFDEFARWFPKFGKTLGEFFAKLSTMSPELARGFGYFMGLLDTIFKWLGGVLILSAKLETGFEKVLQATHGFFKFFETFKPGFAIITFIQNFIWLFNEITLWAPVAADAVREFIDLIRRLLGFNFGPLSGALSLVGAALGVFGGKSKQAGDDASGMGAALGRAGSAAAELGRRVSISTATQEAYVKSIKDSIDAANGFIAGKDRVANAYEAIDRAAQHLADTNAKDLKKGIDLTTQAGRDNWRVLRDIATSANDAAGEIRDMTGDLGAANRVQVDARKKFLDTAAAMNIDSREAQKLADKMFGIPDVDPTVTLQDKASRGIAGLNGKLGNLNKYNAKPSVNLRDNASSRINGIGRALGALAGKTATVIVNAIQTGTIPGRSLGGPIHGPGPKGVDSRLYMLAPGEHVLTAREVDAAGGHAAVMAFRRSLLNNTYKGKGAPAADWDHNGRPGSGGSGGGIDPVTLRRALSGMTLVIDDRTGRTAQLIARGG